MEKLAKALASKLGAAQGSDEEQIAVMAYGFIGIFQLIAILILISIISIIFNFFFEAIVIFLSVGFLRRVIGGAHSKGMYTCLIFSVLFICLLSILAKGVFPTYFSPVLQYSISGACYLISALLIYRLAPDAPSNKPVKTEKKRKRLRKQAFIVVAAFVIISAALMLIDIYVIKIYSLSLALALSALWQALMMTAGGHGLVNLIDKLATMIYSTFKHKSII